MSWAYAFTVFGDRPISVRYARNRSTGTTGTSSSPSTVHDRVPEPGITTGCTSIVSSLNNVMDKAGDNHG